MNRGLATTLAASACIVAMAGPAYAQTQEYRIPAGNLKSVLDAYARQSGRQVIYKVDEVRAARSPGASGRLSADQALEAILSSTGFRPQADSSGALAIVRVSDAAPVVGADAAQTAAGASGGGQTIVVTGTRIRGVQAQASPSITLTREDFSESGVATVQEVFERLPQNLDEISPDAQFATGTSRLASSNTQFASGISLRGLGAQSTLTLVNGARRPGNVDGRVVDVSAIPLAAVERIDIVTGGRSAIYGSDAVAGVVNIVTRRNFTGLETDSSFGFAKDGGERFQISQIGGMKSDRAGIVIAGDYLRTKLLDAVDAGATSPTPSIAGVTARKLPLQPDSERSSLMISGHFDPVDSVELYGDLLYSFTELDSSTDLVIAPGPFSSGSTQLQTQDQHTEQFSANLGVRFQLGSRWQVDVSGLYGESDNSGNSTTVLNQGAPNESRTFGGNDTDATLKSLTAVVDGPLFDFAEGRSVKVAFGGEIRKESLSRISSFLGVANPANKIDRTIKSLFGELVVPVFGEDGPVGSLEVSAAGRYDDYSDFGHTFNPQFGAVWKPVHGLTLRGAYSEAFRAPDLFTLSFGNQNFLIALPDSAAPAGFSPSLLSFGGNPDLGPETAKTWSTGFDAQPSFAPWLKVSGSYWQVDYKNRIDQPADDAIIFFVLQNAALFGPLINRSPTPAQVQAILGNGNGFVSFLGPVPLSVVPFIPGLVTFDNRFNNIGIENVKGLDGQIDARFDIGRNKLTFGINATHFFKYKRRLATGGEAETRLNRPGTPADTRIQGRTGWQNGPFGAFVQVNYVDSYKDIFATPRPEKIDSWTTADVTLRYDTSGVVNGGLLDNTALSLTAQNLFDTKAPFFGSNRVGLIFDSANANATGRLVSFRLTKKW